MKKYVKPELYFERFSLSQSIAACAYDMTLTEEKHCVAVGDEEYGTGGLIILGDWCDGLGIGGWKDGEDYCYQNGSTNDEYRVFIS